MRVVVLTGTGRAFCVGQDLREHIELLQRHDESLWQTVPEHYNPVVELIATMNKPVIAALNGVAAGAGAAFAFAADLRVLADTAGFNLAFAGIALSCDSGSSWSLPRLVGTARAKELLLMPRHRPRRGGPGARPRDQGGARRRARGRRARARRRRWRPARRWPTAPSAVPWPTPPGTRWPKSLAQEAEYMALTGGSEDHAAAVGAFLAKEQPAFTGR